MIPLKPLAEDQKTLAERRWRAASKPRVEQRPCDVGLFGDDAKQTDLIDLLKPERS